MPPSWPHCIIPCHSQDCASRIPLLVPVIMLPRRDSPRPTSGSFGGGRPLSLITTQQVFRASTALTVEVESPESEILPQDLPPVPPPRPTPSSHLPPGNSGLRRRSTRRDTYETFPSALEELVPPRPPGMPMPTIPQLSEFPPPTPTRLRQTAPGGGVGGFAISTSPHHGFNDGDSTADYNYRFETMPPPRADPGSPCYEPADISGGIHANIWPIYNRIAQKYDETSLAKWNKELDTPLLFVSLIFRADSNQTNTVCRPPCSLPSSQPSSSRPSTTWNQITKNRQRCSFTSC